MSFSFLRSTFEPTQTKKLCNGKMKYNKFSSLNDFRSTAELIYFYSKHNFFEGTFLFGETDMLSEAD